MKSQPHSYQCITGNYEPYAWSDTYLTGFVYFMGLIEKITVLTVCITAHRHMLVRYYVYVERCHKIVWYYYVYIHVVPIVLFCFSFDFHLTIEIICHLLLTSHHDLKEWSSNYKSYTRVISLNYHIFHESFLITMFRQ